MPVGMMTTGSFWKVPLMKKFTTTSMGDIEMETVEISVDELTRVLDAMLWVINPYLDDPQSMLDHPYIVELAEVYNTLLASIPFNQSYCFEPVEIN